MDRLKELNEAKDVAREVVARIDNAVRSLGIASSWGVWDILGGGLFPNLIKRGKIKEANLDMQAISSSLNRLNKELEDVNMTLPAEVSAKVSDNVLDVWFDNIFTDIRVQREIKESLTGLKEFRLQTMRLIERIDSEIAKIR